MTEIIAEAGIAHNGDLTTAYDLIDEAKSAGADVVKFQLFDPDQLYPREHPEYYRFTDYAVPKEDMRRIAAYCQGLGIEFMCTPGDVDSLDFLVDKCNVRRIKIGSDDLTNRKLVTRAADTGLPVILSTGMATVDEICQAIPNKNYHNFTLLHCVSLYPCSDEAVNLKAMDALKVFGLPVGYSDHTPGVLGCIAAAAREASVIEKHFMLAGSFSPDEEVSVDQHGLKFLVNCVRVVENMLGSGLKEPTMAELAQAKVLRKNELGFRSG